MSRAHTQGWRRLPARIPALAAAALCLLAVAGRAADPVPSRPHFYFVQITDTHFGTKDHLELTGRLIDKINALPMPIACVVHTGDIGSDNLDKESVSSAATSTLARLKVPIHYVAGNHDLSLGKSKRALEAFRHTFGPLASRAEYRGVTFLMVCTEPLADSKAIPGYDPLAWMADALKNAGDQPVLLFHHSPPAGDFYKNEMHEGWPADALSRWYALVKAHNVRAVICGHFHRDELHWVGNTPLFVAPPVARYYERQPSFRVYEYDNGQVGYYTVYEE